MKANSNRSEAAAKKAKAALRPTNGSAPKPHTNGAASAKAKPAAKAPPVKPSPAKQSAVAKPSAKVALSATAKTSGVAKAAPPKAASAKAVPVKAAAPAKAAPVKAAPVKAAPAKAAAAKAPSKVAAAPVPLLKSSAKAKAAAAAAAAVPAPPAIKKPARKSIKEAAGVSTDAVMRRTGKNWDAWFEVLDTAGAATLDQRGVIAILAQKHGIGPWWQQMIAVGYESLRGKSDKPPAPDGFQISSSCSLDAPLTRVFRLWNDAGERARWLADDRFVIRGTNADKVIRARWGKGTSHVAVSFSEKSGRTEVSVEHHQIESSAAAEQMKAYWAKKLGLLDQLLTPRH